MAFLSLKAGYQNIIKQKHGLTRLRLPSFSRQIIEGLHRCVKSNIFGMSKMRRLTT